MNVAAQVSKRSTAAKVLKKRHSFARTTRRKQEREARLEEPVKTNSDSSYVWYVLLIVIVDYFVYNYIMK